MTEQLVATIAKNVLMPILMQELTSRMGSDTFDSDVYKYMIDKGQKILSDNALKYVLSKKDRNEPFTAEDIQLIAEAAGKDSDGHIFGDDTAGWDDKVLDGYAEHLRNYLYTYKPEATAIDPTINPEQKHIGIMAQDAEKVNPSVVEETEDGVKEVNTGRLSLMNAGAIGDAARHIKNIEDRLDVLEGMVNGR